MKTVFSHHFVYVRHFLLQTLVCAWGRYIRTMERGASRSAPFPPILFLAVWCLPSPLSQHGRLPACTGRLYSHSWLFCLAESNINFPVQRDQEAEARAQARSVGRHGTCALKQEHDIPLMLSSHIMCARSMSSTTSANFSKLLNLHFCLQHPLISRYWTVWFCKLASLSIKPIWCRCSAIPARCQHHMCLFQLSAGIL